MSSAVLQGIGIALGAVIVAALGYIAAWLQAQTRAVQVVAAASVAHATAAMIGGRRTGDAPGGGGARLTYPLWDQLNDPLPTGGLPAGRYQECGEECCAEVIYGQHGVVVSADALRAQLGGPTRIPLTSGEDLVKILAQANISAQLMELPAAAAVAELQAATSGKRAVIALGHWLSPTILHWVLVTRADMAGCSYNDPWGGVRASLPWDRWTALYAGTLVVVQRTPDA